MTDTINIHDYPILEFDANRDAIINPGKPLDDMPEYCVMCFFREVLEGLLEKGEARIIKQLGSEIGQNPIYVLDVSAGLPDGERKRIALVHPGVGAPLSAAFLEETIAHGARKFIACGGAGVLDSSLDVGQVIIPTSAVRDEGTSYHYLPPSREVDASVQGVQAIEATLERHNIPHVSGKTWTTDGIYRETRTKIARRRAEGCISVEMEAAAFFAVAQFRGVEFAQILYAGDDVSGEKWDTRNWHRQSSTREKLFWLAAESVLRM